MKAVERYFNSAFFLYFGLGFVILLIAGMMTFFASLFVSKPGNVSILSLLIIILGTQFALSFPLRAIQGSLTAKMRFDITAGLSLVFRITGALVTILVVLGGGKVIAIALASLVLAAFQGVIWLIAFRREIPEVKISPKYLSQKTIGTLFSFSMITFIAQIAMVFRGASDNYVIGGFLNEAAITHFTVANTLVTYKVNLVGGVVSVLQPYFAQQFGRNNRHSMILALYFGMRSAAALLLFIAFGLLAWGSPFIERWMGVDYLDAYPCLVVLVIGFFPGLLQYPVNGVLMGMARHHFIAVSNNIQAILNLVLSIILVQYYGIFGVALGTCLPSLIINSTLQPWFVAKVLEIPIWQYYGRIFLMIFKCLVALLPAAVFSYYLVQPTYSSLFLTGALSAVTYFPIVILMMFPRQERDKIFQAIFERSSPEG